jgi:hypothetical protein
MNAYIFFAVLLAFLAGGHFVMLLVNRMDGRRQFPVWFLATLGMCVYATVLAIRGVK